MNFNGASCALFAFVVVNSENNISIENMLRTNILQMVSSVQQIVAVIFGRNVGIGSQYTHIYSVKTMSM